MIVNAEIDVDAIKKSIESTVVREARKIVNERITEFVQAEFKSRKFQEKVFDEKFTELMEDNVWTLHHVLEDAVDREEYRTMTDDEIRCFKEGAIMAHTFDLEDMIDEDVLVDRVVNLVADRIFNWVREKPQLKNELAKAIRERDGV